jgi:hypothetical protein
MLLSWNPWLMRSHAVVAGAIDVLTVALTTRRCRWSSSERPQSLMMSVGSTGELKKASPTSFMDFDSV